MTYQETTRKLLEFIDASPSCYHVIANLKKIYEDAGFIELREETSWNITAGKNYYVVRNGSSIVAFKVPEKGWSGFQMAASHSDFPSFKIKTNPEVDVEKHYTCLNVEKYGGMLCAPWFDRPLSIAGRILVEEEGRIVTKLLNIPRDLVMIPNVAIHMNREVNNGYAYNPQVDMIPLFGDETAKGGFIKLIAGEAGVRMEDILDMDMFLYNRMPGTIWGANEEYVSSRSLDDLQCVFGTVQGFLKAENDTRITMCCVFDNEEVGSATKQGAESTMLSDVLHRIADSMGKSREELLQAIANSFLLSADNGHAVHPNHPEKADPTNRPYPNKGVVIKYNANQKYVTDGVSAGIFKTICKKAGVPVQTYVNRSDIAGGSTLGNLANKHVSMNSVDIGLAQLAMHSPYETAGVKDTAYMIKACDTFFASAVCAEGDGVYRIL
ncbi:MAG: M18 family aminopeptidase [Lachnospiraceae bacterium]|jgi:aspartyl aminopeptidase|nr:M18 family aminopeptidase [Lachnospiraceae bacterium]MDD3616741.1 M18 family aminopeptidase [Lachnospiraceae bacterium]